MGNIYRDRIEVLRQRMSEVELDCCLIYTADEHCSEYIDDHFKLREYLSGFTGSAGTLLITQNEAGLWTDGRYFIQAERELECTSIKLHRMGEAGVKNIQEYIRDLAKSAVAMGQCFNMGTDLKLISAAAYKNLKKICCDEGGLITDIDLADLIWKDRPLQTCNPVYALSPEISGKTREEKLSDIRDKIKIHNAEALILTDLADIMWSFDLRGSDIPYNPVAVSFGYIDKDDAYLFIQKGCFPGDLKGVLKSEGINIYDYGAFDEFLESLKNKKILCDLSTMNAHVMERLKGNELINSRSFEYICKHIKNETECSLSKKWHVEDGLAVTRFIYKIKKRVKEGDDPVNEYEAAMLLDSIRSRIRGNLGLSFETISAYESNGAVIHYSPSSAGSKALKPEGFLLVDSGGQYEGATTDVTRTIALGPLTEEMKLDYTAVLKGVIDLADAVFLEGVRGENLDVLARRPVWERYIDYRHGTGHGVGAQLNVHEGPQAFRYRIDKDNSQPPLVPGMITSDEPGIYREGKYGIRIENLLLCVLKNDNEWGRFLGFDTLTLVPYEREAILPGMLTKRQREIINGYHSMIYDLYCDRLDEDERNWLKYVTAKI